jgi:Ca-activated chloride channel family protein
VNRYLIEGVANAGLGEPFIAEDASKAAEVAAKFREYIASPVLTDISFRTDGFEFYDVHPGGFPDLLAQRPIVVFGKWRGSPTGSIELTGLTGQGKYSSVINVADYQSNEANAALRYLWARTRIAELSDNRFAPETDASIAEVTALGLKYNLLTRFTSFIAVREKVVNPNAPANDVNQPLPLPVGVTDMAIGSEPEMFWPIGIAAILMAAVLMFRRFKFLPSSSSTA